MARLAKAAKPPFDPLPWLGGALIVVAVFLAYRPAASGTFIWDDDDYVWNYDPLRAPGGLWTIWTNPQASPQYYPMVFTTFWVEARLWRGGTPDPSGAPTPAAYDPRGFRETNVLLHAISALLVWRLLRRLGVPGAYAVALLFAVHPVMVESVAWITERKNTLSMLFYLLAARAYLRFAGIGADLTPAPGSEPRATTRMSPRDRPRRGLYAAALALFAAALLSKTVTASLPAALALVLWWKRGRVTARDWLLLAPMFALGLAGGWLTAHLEASHVGASGAEWNYSVAQRVLNAGRAVWFYAAKLVWPADLSFVYSKWPVDPAAAWQWIFPVGVVGVLAALFVLRRRLGRGPLAGALIFVGTLVPALGFVNVFPMRYTFVADHYQYHATVAFIALVVAGVALVVRRSKLGLRRPLAPAALVGAVAVALFVATFRRAGVYRDSTTLWTDAVAKSPDSWMAWGNLGEAARSKISPDFAAARRARQRALELNPDVADTQFAMAQSELEERDYPAAVARGKRAVELEPRLAQAWNLVGFAYRRMNRPADAIEWLQRAVQINPRYWEAHYNLGQAYRETGDLDLAAEHLTRSIDLHPSADAFYALADVRRAQKRLGEAEAALRHVLELQPGNAQAHFDLAKVLAALGRKDEAMGEINAAVRLNPDIGKAPRER
jgi:tetratricopeptide (TPR) repeat protein